MSMIADIYQAAAPIIGSILLLIGALLAVIGTVGVLRFPDIYSRLHAASVTDTAAVTLGVVGMILLSPHWLIAFKLAAIWMFIFITGPTSSHALANAAHTAGVQPLIGREARNKAQTGETPS